MSNVDTETWNTAARELDRSTTLTSEEEERLALAEDRIRRIPAEAGMADAFRDFFEKEAFFLTEMCHIMHQAESGELDELSLEELQRQNREAYADILPENYAHCYGNPAYAVQKFGKEYATLLGFLYTELRGAVVYAYEDKKWDMLVSLELFLEVYHLFTDAAKDDMLPKPADVRDALYWYVSDYSMDMMNQRTRETLDPNMSFAKDLIMESDLSDLRYLYRFGEYITDNELQLAEFLNSLEEEEIDGIARTWTEGYRRGFLAEHKDITKKKTVNIRYRTGFERVVRQAVWQFEDMGLESVIYRSATHAVNKRQQLRIGYYGAVPNPQFEYDHRNDAVVFLDEAFVTRKLQALRCAYEHYRTLAGVHGGPAVLDVFGEIPFTPQANADAPVMTREAQKQQVRYNNEAGQITNRYIRGSERSFTIIAYPVPEIGYTASGTEGAEQNAAKIGENGNTGKPNVEAVDPEARFEAIFRETEKINNLDNAVYQKIQQKLIDALDEGTAVHVVGMNGNRTDLTVKLHELEDPAHQTNFENCVADVNIPVGEVFTSPVLHGTNGILNVSQVYLNDFLYRDLVIQVRDGLVADYGCSNFGSEEENRRYVEENILFHHRTVPMGECAIGTNTTAYRMAKRFGIADRLPILIAEKMGPHFAFGDTCYSWQEDMPVYNPDGKEVIARDNEISILRKTDPDKAYFGCHTDITIPYEELGLIEVIRKDGGRTKLIENGRFVLPGTEELNKPLEGLI